MWRRNKTNKFCCNQQAAKLFYKMGKIERLPNCHQSAKKSKIGKGCKIFKSPRSPENLCQFFPFIFGRFFKPQPPVLLLYCKFHKIVHSQVPFLEVITIQKYHRQKTCKCKQRRVELEGKTNWKAFDSLPCHYAAIYGAVG